MRVLSATNVILRRAVLLAGRVIFPGAIYVPIREKRLPHFRATSPHAFTPRDVDSATKQLAAPVNSFRLPEYSRATQVIGIINIGHGAADYLLVDANIIGATYAPRRLITHYHFRRLANAHYTMRRPLSC